MSRHQTFSDDALRQAFVERASAGRPDGLYDLILADVAATSQRWVWGARLTEALTTPILRPAVVILVVVALLVALAVAIATVGAARRDPPLVRPQPRLIAPPAVTPEGASWGQVNYPVDPAGYVTGANARVTVDIIDESATLLDYTARGTPPFHPAVEPGSVVVINEVDDVRVVWVLWTSCFDERVYRITLDETRRRLEVTSQGCGQLLGTHQRRIRIGFSVAIQATEIVATHTNFPALRQLPGS
jgi:hypothetical protein